MQWSLLAVTISSVSAVFIATSWHLSLPLFLIGIMLNDGGDENDGVFLHILNELFSQAKGFLE